MLDFDHHRSGRADRRAAAPTAMIRTRAARSPHAGARRREPRGPARALRAASRAATAVTKPATVTTRAVTSVARQTAGGGGARGCLSAPARALLERIEGQFGAMQVISTCRPGARIAGTGRISRHASGNAIDFNAGGRKGEVVRWLIANHKAGGIMTYAGMSHIHVDIGYHFVALNAGGRRR